jgi:uncharacterized protein YndB with AHSA1/START domain
MEQHTAIEPVRVSICVNGTPERAFQVFTAEMATWWPLATHSIEPDQVMTAEMDPRLGGRIVERHHDGTEANWGVITTWEPPHRLVFSWNPSYEDRPETEVEVTFSEHAEGTRVVLEHRGWERLGPSGTEMRAGYAEGWGHILSHCYASLLP